jgi:RNA polymerase sigma-B factor
MASSSAWVPDAPPTVPQALAQSEEGTAEFQYVRNTLVELNLALVRFAAGRFRHRSEPWEDIVQAGTVGLIKAIDRFDPALGYEFTTFALPTITGEIKRFFRDTGWAVHVPRHLQERRIRLARAGDELAFELGREPTTAELAERLELTVDEVDEGRTAAAACTAYSLDFGGDEDENLLAARSGYTDRRFETAENLQALAPVIAGLPERERVILSLRFTEDLTQSQIGRRLGISQMHVSRLLGRTLSELRECLLAEG